MTSCFENMQMPSCVWFEGGEKRNALVSMLAGTLFFVGWWFIIDAHAKYPSEMSNAYHVCGVFGTISLFISWRFRSQFFNQKPQKFFTDGIMILPEKWRNIVDNNGRAMMPSVKNFCGFWLKNCDRKRHELFPGLNISQVNSVTNAQIRGEAYNGGCLGARGARSWLFIGFVMGFAAVIAACWILFANYVALGAPHHWPGVGLFLQNVFIFLGSLTYKFGRSEDQWG